MHLQTRDAFLYYCWLSTLLSTTCIPVQNHHGAEELQTAWRLVLSMKPWSYIWLEFGLFSTIIAIIRACACWALYVVTLTNTVHLIYIYIMYTCICMNTCAFYTILNDHAPLALKIRPQDNHSLVYLPIYSSTCHLCPHSDIVLYPAA